MTTTQLEISPEEAKSLLEIYSLKRKEFTDTHADIIQKLQEYNSMIEKLDKIIEHAKELDGNADYPMKGSWNSKIRFLLKRYEAMTVKQLRDAIMEIENIDPLDTQKIHSGVAPTMSTGYNNGKYSRANGVGCEYIYSLKKAASLRN